MQSMASTQKTGLSLKCYAIILCFDISVTMKDDMTISRDECCTEVSSFIV